jgi:Mrp family chromosome partitioning ATPase
LRNPSLSSSLAPTAELGIRDVMSGTASLHEVTWTDPLTNLVFLPAVAGSRISFTSEMIGSDALRDLFRMLRESFDYIIVDLSPVAPFVDVRVAADLLDSYIFVVEWGRTNVNLVRGSLDMANEIYDKLLGLVINKVDMKALKHYGSSLDTYYSQHHA